MDVHRLNKQKNKIEKPMAKTLSPHRESERVPQPANRKERKKLARQIDASGRPLLANPRAETLLWAQRNTPNAIPLGMAP